MQKLNKLNECKQCLSKHGLRLIVSTRMKNGVGELEGREGKGIKNKGTSYGMYM